MNGRVLNLQRIAALLFRAVIMTWIFIIGKDLFTPLVFGLLLALILIPVVNFWEKHLRSPVVSIVLTFMAVILPLIGISYFICWQSADIYSEMPSVSNKIEEGLDDTFRWMDKKFKLKRGESQDIIMESIDEIKGDKRNAEPEPANLSEAKVQQSGKVIGTGVRVSSAFITGFFISLVYTFLLLLYRSAIKKFFLVQFAPTIRKNAARYLKDVRTITQKYLYGVFIVMLILGTLNSVGLWAIGLKYAFFFGFLAAFLAIIPYVGTIIGGALPFAYSMATTDEWWQPICVVVLFIIVQLLEGNFITPKIAGSSVKLNPLVSIFILFAGGLIWEIAGMVLALPLLAIFKTTCRYVPFLRPVSLLLSSELYEKESLFDEKFDGEKYRLWSFFSTENK
jgi:predicted PurR-regulated permease PerM